MKERLLQLLDLEHLTPSKFADLIGVQRSSVSHILSGRNKPSFDFLQKTLSTFTGLKADWLMLGEGPIYEQMGRDSANLFDEAGPISVEPENKEIPVREELPLSHPKKPEEEVEAAEDLQLPVDVADKSKKIIQVMLFYDDDTFITYRPSE